MANNAQTAYNTAFAIGLPGQIANEEKCNKVSRTVETALGIVFGAPAFRGAGDHGVVAAAAFAATGAGSAAASGNIGTGVITASPAVASPAKQGRYTAVLIATGATAAFLVYDPSGKVVGDGVVGSASTIDGIGPFTISNAGTMTAGDTYYVDVTYTANAKFLGLSVLNPAVPAQATTPDRYPQYYTGAFMDMGAMYVQVGATGSVPDAQVYYDVATGKYVTDSSKILIPDARFDTTAAADGIAIVVLELRRS